MLPADDPFGFQGYLDAVRAPFAWSHATGRRVKVGVFDQGTDVANAELRPNTDVGAERGAANLVPGAGQPATSSDLHGTWVAGVIGTARDARGIVGVAYDATLVSIYSTLSLEPRDLTEGANAFTYEKSLGVLNNSRGFGNVLQAGTDWAFLDDAASRLFAPALRTLRDLAANGRGGLGTVVVQSAGNAYRSGHARLRRRAAVRAPASADGDTHHTRCARGCGQWVTKSVLSTHAMKPCVLPLLPAALGGAKPIAAPPVVLDPYRLSPAPITAVRWKLQPQKDLLQRLREAGL